MNKSKLKVQDISFCGKKAQNIIPSEIKQLVIDSLTKHDIKINQRYANLLQFQSLNYLAKQPHLISIKTAGTNYFLYLTHLNGVPSCLFIDRKIKSGYSLPRVLLVHMRFADELFEDTLLDGELVKDNDDNWMFLLQDLLIYKGKKVKQDIIGKYKIMYKMLCNEYVPDPMLDNCPLRIKKLFTYADYQKMITQFIPRLTYPIRGLYFNTLFTKHSNYLFLYPSKDTMHGGLSKKNNPAKTEQKEDSQNDKQKQSKNILVLKKTEESDIYNIHCMKDETLVEIGMAHVNSLKMSKKIRRAFQDNESVYAECTYNTRFNKWEPQEIIDESTYITQEQDLKKE